MLLYIHTPAVTTFKKKLHVELFLTLGSWVLYSLDGSLLDSTDAVLASIIGREMREVLRD